VRIALTSGLSRRQVSDDLGVGLSTLNKWVNAHRGTDVVSTEDRELARENERLRREIRILKEERDILKKPPVLREPKVVRFRFVEEQRGAFSVDRLCRVMNVSPRGLWAFRSRPASRRQHMDMVVLAHIKEQSRLSLGSYGRPRMTEELKEVGVDVGHRRVGRLMRENGIVVERTRKFKATTDSDHTFSIAPNLLDRDFTADRPNQKWRATSATFGPARGGSIWRSSLICIQGG
jgi:transposase